MKPIFITISQGISLTVIPDSDAHVNGHPVLTYTYSIFRRKRSNLSEVADPENLLLPEKKNNPNYLGYITFEQPGKLFTYTADGNDDLSDNDIQEVIEEISHYRDSPQMWSIE